VNTRVVTTRRAIKVQRDSIFSHLENGRKRSVYVYCENSGDLSVNLIETLSISRGFRLERSPVATCRSGQPCIGLTVAQYLFEQRLTLPFINGRAKCQTHRILQPRQLG
jgi:hypothetical protein